MFYVYFFCYLSKLFFCREVRLRHPKKQLYVGGDDFYPNFVKIGRSDVFIDKESEEVEGKIIIKVKNRDPKVWDVEASVENLIFYPEHGGRNQRFKVLHVARDIIAIESDLGKCISYTKSKDRFIRENCRHGKKYKNQIFVITNVSGLFKGDEKAASKWGVKTGGWGSKNAGRGSGKAGKGSNVSGWANAGEMDIKWGECDECLKGGFGSEKQGDDFDNVMRMGFKTTKPYSDYISDMGNFNNNYWNLGSYGFSELNPFWFTQ